MLSVNPNLMKPARYPDSYYYQVRPLVERIIAEMDDMSVSYPTQQMYEMMLDRVYTDLGGMIPDMEEEDETAAGVSADMAAQGPVGYYDDHDRDRDRERDRRHDRRERRRRFRRDLIGIIILNELLRRRRFYF
ncbi:MAG: hypothetical protein ACM3WV_10415 [Bacillota bacterium]